MTVADDPVRPAAGDAPAEPSGPSRRRFLAYVLAAIADDGEPLLVVFNGAQQEIELTLAPWDKVGRWTRILDTTANATPTDDFHQAPGAKLPAPAESILVFAGQP
jgi:hypothetical protein